MLIALEVTRERILHTNTYNFTHARTAAHTADVCWPRHMTQQPLLLLEGGELHECHWAERLQVGAR